MVSADGYAELERCFEKVRLLWNFIEKNPEVYTEALEAGMKVRGGDTSGIGKLVEFLRSWNKARGYNENKLNELLEGNLKSIVSEFEKEHNEEEFIRKLRNILGDAVKKKTNEIIGAIKLAHVLYPEIFPLIDNPISEGLELKPEWRTLKLSEYFAFKHAVDHAVDEVIKKFGLNFSEREKYKRVDELLYLWYTWKGNNGESLKELFEGLEWKECIEVFEKFIETIKEEIMKSRQS
ncbi:hypothetical protein [Thermococcus thermotolerans]|uniref:hypothetical protein n=1 Tax=Thermococcus thermotolerans TaxID=2969672 RepID=UPI002156F77B|nr:hypothetical protein [Thermococcus thermotolerans]